MQFPALSARWVPRAFGLFLLAMAAAVLLLAGLMALAAPWLRLDAVFPGVLAGPGALALGAGLCLGGAVLWWWHGRWQRAGAVPVRGQLLRTITYRTVLVLGVVVLGAGLTSLVLVRDNFERAARDALFQVARSHATALDQALTVGLAQARALAHRRAVQQLLARLAVQRDDTRALADLQELANTALTADVVGITVFGLDADHPLVSAGRDTGSPGEPALSLRAPGQAGQLGWQQVHMLVAESDVLVAGHPAGRLRLLLRLPVIDQLLHDLRRSGEGADAVLCSREGPDLTVCAPSRFYPDQLRIPMFDGLGRPRLPVNHALLGDSGVGEAVDLRQVPVLVAHVPVGRHGLALVVKTDVQAVYAPLRQHVAVVVVVFGGLVVAGTLALRLAVQPLVARLVREQRRTRLITDNLPVLIAYLDRQQRLTFVNDTFTRWTGISRQSALGRPVREVIGEAGYARRQPAIERALAGERVMVELDSEVLGERRDLRNEYIPDRRPSGEVVGLYVLSTDVTALKQVQRELTLLARFDTLTGLPNRHQFNEHMAEALARSARSGQALALLFLDIDRFKAINDQHGHATGDAVLQEFGRRVLGAVRSTDFVARLAGDEFVVIAEGLHEATEVELIARKVLSRVARPAFELDGRRLVVHTSIGVAFHRDGTAAPKLLLARADAALYEAKARGRNTVATVVCESAAAQRLVG